MADQTQYDDRLRPPYGEAPDPIPCLANGTTGPFIGRYRWEPGNGTLYDLVYAARSTEPTEYTGETQEFILALMNSGWDHAAPIAFRDELLHYSYIMEKMGLNEADACGVLGFLERMGHAVGYPRPQAVGE